MEKRRGRKAKTEAINISELNEWLQKDINRSAGIKCQALISIKNNVSVSDVCKVLGVTRECVRLWRKTIEKDGPEGFVKYRKTGRKSALTYEIKLLLQSALTESPQTLGYNQAVWDGKLVCKFLMEKQKINISVRTAQNWLNEINFTRQRPRKKYSKENKEEIEIFKKK